MLGLQIINFGEVPEAIYENLFLTPVYYSIFFIISLDIFFLPLANGMCSASLSKKALIVDQFIAQQRKALPSSLSRKILKFKPQFLRKFGDGSAMILNIKYSKHHRLPREEQDHIGE